MSRSRWDATSTVAAVILGCGLLFAAPPPHAVQDGVKFFDITPDNDGPMAGQPAIGVPDCPDPYASGRNGGRVNGLVGVPGDANTYFAASEVGGLFKSGNGGASWKHLDGHVPATTWDVAVAPGGQRVYATSFYDGRRVPLTGLEMSTDGGTTELLPVVPRVVSQTFELVVVTTSSFNATTIDPKLAQVGNTSGVIDALQNRTADVNGDGRPDLVVSYSVAAARRVQSVSGPKSPLAFRYGARDGTGWLVSDISKLGSPLVSGP